MTLTTFSTGGTQLDLTKSSHSSTLTHFPRNNRSSGQIGAGIDQLEFEEFQANDTSCSSRKVDAILIQK